MQNGTMSYSGNSTTPPPWHALPAADAAGRLGVDPGAGLSSHEAARRLAEHGPNQLDEAPREPRWRAFLRQFQDLLIIILLVAAVVSLVVSRSGRPRSRSRWW